MARLTTTLCLLVLFSGCAKDPPPASPDAPVSQRLTTARASGGKYISWREHIIDSVELSGVALAGSDGLVMDDLDRDGFDDAKLRTKSCKGDKE
jgi:hypothetical protein